MSPCCLGIDGVEVSAYQEIRPDGMFFAIPEKHNNPDHAARFFKSLDGDPRDPKVYSSCTSGTLSSDDELTSHG